ncbi:MULTISPECIES: hypothetical protein [Candidatus Rhabdochlamydia]|nr:MULTISPECIES: hypothetical protein [Rhabdochlamydia]
MKCRINDKFQVVDLKLVVYPIFFYTIESEPLYTLVYRSDRSANPSFI